MKNLDSIDYCMLVCGLTMLALISDVLAVHFGMAQQTIRLGALAAADVTGVVWAVTGLGRKKK